MSQDWYYALGGNQHGPHNEGEIRSKIAQGEIKFDTLLWKEGMSGWKKAQDIAEFQNIQRSMPNAVIPPSRPPVAPAQQTAQQVYNAPGSNPQMSQQQGGQGTTPYIQSYLWQSIVCTLLCCLPFGVVGIVYASKVEGLLRHGQVAEAIEASEKAKMWCWLSFGITIAAWVLYVLAIAVAGA